jgi:predicted O-linked N-acetylglucosamine transferase (SPINDLY family)
LFNPEFIQAILDDQIDIAIDLTGHTGNNRLTALAAYAAPLQVSWLGYPCTTGLGAIDYRITEAVADPLDTADPHYSEKLVRLPRSFLCYRPPDEAPAPGPLPSLCGNPFTFGSFNNLPKVNDAVIDAWAEILRRVPGSRLLLKSRAFACREPADRMRLTFADRGIDPQRIELVGWRRDPAEHLLLYGQVDLALDPFPYNGTTTSCEAMWMGVPVLTLAGERHAARVGASLITQVGLTDLITATAEDYVERAVALAASRDGLAEIRETLRARMAASPLCDAAAFARDMEAAYRAVWRDWCARG